MEETPGSRRRRRAEDLAKAIDDFKSHKMDDLPLGPRSELGGEVPSARVEYTMGEYARLAAIGKAIVDRYDAEHPERESTTQLYSEILSKVVEMMGDRFADVITSYRRLEDEHGHVNSIGRQNMIEAFSHLSSLFIKARELSRDEQLVEVAHATDHFRRVMMESYEIDLNVAIGKILNAHSSTSRVSLYYRHAAPAIREGKLQGHLSPDEVAARRDVILARARKARNAKVGEKRWPAFVAAASEFETASIELNQLELAMGQAVDAALNLHDNRLFGFVGVALGAMGIGMAIGGILAQAYL
jgi:hypothetical protein